MPTSEVNFQARSKIVRELYAALNRNDIPAVLSLFDSQIVRTEFEDSPSGGTYRGLEAVKAHFHKGRDTWAEGGCEPEQLIDAGDKVVVLVHVKVKLKQNQEWVEGRPADVFTFREGKITHMHSFFEPRQALEFAGVSRPL